MNDPYTCPHATLGFGSGAYYIICHDCNQFWVAKKHRNDTDLDYDQGHSPAEGLRRK